MSLQTPHDIPLQIRSENASAERRITPSWNVAQLKTKLEPVTGIPPSAQRLTLNLPDREGMPIEADDEERVPLSRWPLQPYAEILVTDTRPATTRLHLPDPTSVPKYTMPASQYATRADSVLAWKKANKLGRFDPHAADAEVARKEAAEREIRERGIALHKRCILLPPPPPTSAPPSHPSEKFTSRRGTILYIGPLPSLSHSQTPNTSTSHPDSNSESDKESPNPAPKTPPPPPPQPPPTQIPWIGIALDEPQGRNDGTLNGKRYFECRPGHGVFVRPERVEVGEWGVLDLEEGLEDEEDEGEGDMEEI